MSSSHSALFCILVVIFVGFIIQNSIQSKHHPVAPHINHKYIVLNDFVSERDEQNLMQMFETIGPFASSKSDFSSKQYVEIGEGYAPSQNKSCSKHGTLYHKASDKCLYLPRIDAVQWYMKSGGYEGWKERIPKLTSRISSFIRHEFAALNRSEFRSLFESQLFIESVSTICPAHVPFFKPIELNLNLVLPGQGFLSHHDAVYFDNASRHQFPLWLLTVMKASNLFNDNLIHQVQAIVYIGTNNQTGGQLYFYPNGVRNDVILLPPTSKSAVIMDGTEIVHGTVVYQADKEPLPLWQNTRSFLQFDEQNKVWRVYVDEQPTEHVYAWSDIRGSIAFRALCFEDAQTAENWNENEIESELSVDGIMESLKHDLIAKKRIDERGWNAMDKYDLGLWIISEYVQLPKSELAWIPFNYCLLLDILPIWLANSFVFQLVETIMC